MKDKKKEKRITDFDIGKREKAKDYKAKRTKDGDRFQESIVEKKSKLNNFEREINPILKGSIYDAKFSKKWIDSCDEALKLGIYKSAYKAYKSVNFTCILLWLFCIIGSTFWDFGIAPIAIVTIIWLVQSTTYYIETIRVSKSKNTK